MGAVLAMLSGMSDAPSIINLSENAVFYSRRGYYMVGALGCAVVYCGLSRTEAFALYLALR